ncbi:hypothetical protein B0H34DRAFT_682266 [Crassisporium funariophilum]|nr:hypothetical protein B0H34DRAFT_682266 [Crassisporium funariophilum]
MLWSFKALATFNFDPSRLLNASTSTNVNKNAPGSAVNFSTPIINVTAPAIPEPWMCQCGPRNTGFCPYCDYQDPHQSQNDECSMIETLHPLSVEDLTNMHYGNADMSRPRKLRKSRREEYQLLQWEPLHPRAVISARPDSILSTHSRTPLLNHGLPTNPDYLPLAGDRRTPNKLEKRDKRERYSSMPSMSSAAFAAIPESSRRKSRVVKSKSFLIPKPRLSVGPRPEPVFSSIETDDLVSLAWTGEICSSIKSPEPLSAAYDPLSPASNLGVNPLSISRTSSGLSTPGTDANVGAVASESLSSGSSSQPRRSVLRKPKDPAMPPQRPWTLAMAITDDGITDEKLMDDLEAMRIKEELLKGHDHNEYSQGLFLPPQYGNQPGEMEPEHPIGVNDGDQEEPATPPECSWNAARQAFLVCRELVRTERRYLSSLKTLITNGTNTPPPSLMLSYLPGLITASDELLQLMEENPSVQGVSEAFLSCQGNLHEAFVNWCEVVGQFFESEQCAKSKSDSEDAGEGPSSPNPRSRATSLRTPTVDSGLSLVIPEPNKIRRNSKQRPTVRDLAIVPTQRIMRYVLLFKELHLLTPTTRSSYATVKQAVLVAESIAQSANKAQGHSAFIQPSSCSPSPNLT